MSGHSQSNDADLLKPEQVREMTGLSRSGVYKRIATGKFEAVWTRGRVQVPRSAVEAYLAERGRKAAA